MKLADEAPSDDRTLRALIDYLDRQSQTMARLMERTSQTLGTIDRRLESVETAMRETSARRGVDLFLRALKGAHQNWRGVAVIVCAVVVVGIAAVGVAPAWPEYQATYLLHQINEAKK